MAQGCALVSAAALLITMSACAARAPKGIEQAQPHYEEGMRHFQAGAYGTAILEFTRAVQIHPDFPDAYYRRGCARLKLVVQGQVSSESWELEKAVEDFTRALAILPIYYEASYNRGLAHAALGRYRQAAQDFQNVLVARDVELVRDAHAKLGEILEEKFENMQSAAIRHYARYVELGGKDASIHERLSALKARNAESAEQAGQEAQASALLVDAMQAAEGGDKARALSILERAIASGALPKDKRDFAAAAYAQWRLELASEAAAAALLKEGQGLLSEGNKGLAIQLLERAAKRYPDTRVVRDEIGPLLRSLEESHPK